MVRALFRIGLGTPEVHQPHEIRHISAAFANMNGKVDAQIVDGKIDTRSLH